MMLLALYVKVLFWNFRSMLVCGVKIQTIKIYTDYSLPLALKMEIAAVENVITIAKLPTTTITTVEIESPDQELYLLNRRDEEERDRCESQEMI